ncbi:MAG: hypothetical protein K2X38_18530 [Gemmataceae bacterium]|nr:hypothetical protein [Gemmataceae bacterium]
MSRLVQRSFAIAAWSVMLLANKEVQAQSGSPDAGEIFQKRLIPIFKSPNPSSCVQCHLAGVDLKNYIRPSHEQTFVSLRDQGLIDLDDPEKSKILQLIGMGKNDPGAALIHEKNRKAELAAFGEWIRLSAQDPKLRNLPKAKAEDLKGPERPIEVVRHARKDRVLESFENTIWAMRFRCMSCHIEGTAENRELVEKHGPRVAWFKKDGPAAALEYLAASRLIDVERPEKSLLLTKPLNEVEHGGGKKFIKGDQGYRAFLAFVEDFARIKKNSYPDAASLPAARDTLLHFGSESWLKISNTLPDWGDRILQVNVHAWNANAARWDASPIATSDRQVFGKGKLWQHSLTLMTPKDSELAKAWKNGKPSLAQGKYMVKVYVDLRDRLGKTPDAVLGKGDFVGQVEIQSAWPEGYGRMTAVDARKLRK